MVKMNDNTEQLRKRKRAKGKRFLLTFVCIFLAIVIGVGGTFGIMTAIRYSQAAARVGNRTVSEGTARYLLSRYKTDYISILSRNGIEAKDTEEFWAKDTGEGITYGEALEKYLKESLSQLLASSVIYDEYVKENNAREVAEKTANDVLKLRYNSDENYFNEKSAKYGFDYDDYIDAIELLYMEAAACDALYGAKGENLKNYPSQCIDYLNTFSRVKILFLRENDKYVLGEGGNYIPNEHDDGETAKTVEMTEGEKAIRRALIERLEGYIREDGEMGMTEEVINSYLFKGDGDVGKSDGDPYWSDGATIGYYFNKNSEATQLFYERYSGVVEAAYDMQIGEYRMVQCSSIDGVCLLYKCEPMSAAYSNTDNPFFLDFYEDATSYLYPLVRDVYTEDVIFGKTFDKLNLQNLEKITGFNFNSFVY